MGLIGASLVLQQMELFRMCTILGRYGSYKTALAFRMAYALVKRGRFRHVVANLPSSLNSDLKDIKLRNNEEGKPQYLDTVFVLDEGGIFLRSEKDIDEFRAYLRKLNSIMIIPTVLDVPAKAKVFTIQRTLDFQAIGIPLLYYKGFINSGRMNEDFAFSWWKPAEIYGLYDTNAMPSDADDIKDFIFDTIDNISRSQGYDNKSYRKTKLTTTPPEVNINIS